MKKIIILMLTIIFALGSIQIVLAHRSGKREGTVKSNNKDYHHQYQEKNVYCSRSYYDPHQHDRLYKSREKHNNVKHHRKNEGKVSNESRNE